MKVFGLAGAAAVAAVTLIAPGSATASEPTARDGVPSTHAALPHRTSSAPHSTSTRYFITFDTGTSPCGFADTAPLRNEYAGLGVHFSGASPDTGGAVLNQCGNFGIAARSGQEFLAFNSGVTYATTPERIRFDELQRSVQLYVANGSGPGGSTYTLRGFRDGHMVASTSVTTTLRGWFPLKVVSTTGIQTVVLKATASAFVVDDLQYLSLH